MHLSEQGRCPDIDSLELPVLRDHSHELDGKQSIWELVERICGHTSSSGKLFAEEDVIIQI